MLVHSTSAPPRKETQKLPAFKSKKERESCNIVQNDDAMMLSVHSTLAARAIGEGNYTKALEYYRIALDEYLDGTPTVVELVNAAATCFNLGALSKKVHHYNESGAYFVKAEEIYKKCYQIIRHATSQAHGADASCEVCLLQLIVETLQARAHMHYKHQKSIDPAIECHEEVVRILEQRNPDDGDLSIFRVRFVALAAKERRNLLMRSLQSLGKMYVERGDFEDGLIAYQQALSVIREFGPETTFTWQRRDEIAQIINVLSNMYMKKLSTKVPQLQRLARIEEASDQWDRAIACWERVLYLESQEHGEESSPVADALCQIARVMTLQGNGEGALDLYHAAFTKYKVTQTPLPREAVGNTTTIFCQLMLHDEALEYLDVLIRDARTIEEEAWILCQRGRIYLEQGLLHEAGQALCQSAQMFDSDDDYVFNLLQKVEFLQQRTEVGYPVHATIPSTKMPLESIIEDDENSSFSGDKTQLLRQSRGPSGPSARRSGQLLLKTVDEQRQEDVATPENAEDPMIDPATSEDRSTKLFELLGSEQDPSFFDDDGLPSGENNSDDDVPSDESISDLGRESTPASPASQTLSRVHIVTPLRGTDRDGDCEANAGTEQTVDANQEIAPLPLPPVLGRTQLVDRALSGSMYISSDDESDQLNEDQSETHSDGMPVPKNDATAISEQESVSSALPEIRPSEVDIGSVERIRDQPPSDGLKNPMAQSEDLVDILEAIEVNLVQQHYNREADSTPQEPILAAPAPSWPPSNQPKADLAPRSQVARILSNRSRLVMALSSPFRRTRSKKSLVSGTLSALDEEKEVSEFISDTKLDNRQTGMDMSESFEGAPVSYIAMRKRSAADEGGDDESLVSQITFKWEECKPQKSTNDNQWWWGVTAEGLEGWFPTSYVHQAVVAAEGFLSARAIHEKVKNRPLDFESDEESEFSESEFDVISGDQAKVPSPSTKRDKPENLDCGPDHKVKEAAVQAIDGKDQATKSTGSSSKRKTTLAFQIEEKQAYLEDQSTTCEIGDSTTAIILFELASLQSKNGEFGEALKNLQQALQLQKAGKNTEDACRTLQLMADINSRAKYYQAALSCYAEARKIQEAVNGYYHDEVANILNRQGNVLARQGEFDLAMDNHKEALRILKECCGEEVKNPLVSQTLIQIGAVYYKERNSLKTIQKNRDGYTTFIESGMLEVIGRAHEDRGSYRMAIAFFEEKLQCLNNEKKSEDRQQIADTLNSLGMLSCRAGLYLEAMDYYAQALGILKELGCDDVQLAKAKVLSANVQYFLGHFEKALKLLETALLVMRAKAGMEHETVAGTLFHIGVANVALGNFSIGMSNLREATKIQTKILGSEHPATLRTRREIANLLVSWESNVDLALQEYRAILEIQRRIHGSKHPNIAETLHFIGCAEAKNGDKDLALRTLEDCYNMRLEFLGTDHPLQATTLHKIAKIRLQKGRVKKAIHICNSALQIRKEALSENHVDVAGLLATKASCLLARGSYNEANKLFLEASSITREAVGTSHPAFADVQVQVGAMHLRTCHFEEAAAAISAALDIYRKSGLNEDHPAIKGALEELEKVERAEMLCV